MRRQGRAGRILAVAVAAVATVVAAGRPARADVTAEQVERAIRDGVRFLKNAQRGDGSWADSDIKAVTGATSLITLALLTAGEPADEPHVARALEFLERFTADELNRTYSVGLQTMAFATADPARYRVRLVANVRWLERAQLKSNDSAPWPGSWTYTGDKKQPGDNSNTQYALLGLNAAAEAGVKVDERVWALSRTYWERTQRNNGGWCYTPDDGAPPTASMTCAGVASLIITGLKQFQGQEVLVGDAVQNCGRVGQNLVLQRGIDWLGANFSVSENVGRGDLWKYYYLYGLERAGRLSGQRFFGNRDWYREGAEKLVSLQDQLVGKWAQGVGPEKDPLLTTSFALLFLAKGRAPVLINKLKHGPGDDWNNDRDDARHLTALVSRDWKHLLTWQVVDPAFADVAALLQAPILYFNGHEAPSFNAAARKNLRSYVEQGGFIVAEACCGEPAFDQGFRALMKDLFPEPEYDLKPLAEDHPVWRARWPLKPEVHPLWGIEHGCRTVVIYSPQDLSCFWNQMEAQPDNPAVIKAQRVGQNIVDYATGRELPAEKLAVREVRDFTAEPPRRGELHIAKLRHAGDWNVAPMAVPNLTSTLRDRLNFQVVLNHRELLPSDPALINYPLIYIHGRGALSFGDDDLERLRRHLVPGGGTFFADAACGSPAFDASFRQFVAKLLPGKKLEPIPPDDDVYTEKVGYDLSEVQYSKAAGGGRNRPELEGVKIDGHWAVIYSRYDIGCALERQQGLDCKGYNHESAMKIAANIVLYSTLP